MDKRIRIKDFCLDLAAMVAGSLLYAVSLNCFSAPNNIVPGGVTGVATLIHHLTDLPIGIMILVFNIPLFLLAAKLLGMKFLFKTLIATVLMSVLVDLTAYVLPSYAGDRLLASLFGGVLSGAGIAIIFLRGATTGGTDIAARLIQLKYPHLSIGRLLLLIDALVFTAAALVYKSIESALYSVILIFLSSQVIDKSLYGAVNGKMMMIVTGNAKEIAREITTTLSRGATIINAHGAYTGQDKQIVLCAVRRNELYNLRAIMKKCDPEAFAMVTEAGEIIGEGFNQET